MTCEFVQLKPGFIFGYLLLADIKVSIPELFQVFFHRLNSSRKISDNTRLNLQDLLIDTWFILLCSIVKTRCPCWNYILYFNGLTLLVLVSRKWVEITLSGSKVIDRTNFLFSKVSNYCLYRKYINSKLTEFSRLCFISIQQILRHCISFSLNSKYFVIFFVSLLTWVV